jgi:hypothetical protein
MSNVNVISSFFHGLGLRNAQASDLLGAALTHFDHTDTSIVIITGRVPFDVVHTGLLLATGFPESAI